VKKLREEQVRRFPETDWITMRRRGGTPFNQGRCDRCRGLFPLGEALARHYTTCTGPSSMRGGGSFYPDSSNWCGTSWGPYDGWNSYPPPPPAAPPPPHAGPAGEINQTAIGSRHGHSNRLVSLEGQMDQTFHWPSIHLKCIGFRTALN
jgi:hypothetical protein